MTSQPKTQFFDYERHQCGDESLRQVLFTKEFEVHYWKIHRYVMVFVGNRHDADDVMQEVAVILWDKFDEFEQGTSFMHWAKATAFRVTKTFLREKKKRTGRGLDDSVLQQLAKSFNRSNELLELRQSYLKRCLRKLSSPDRTFLLKCEHRHGNVAKIAKELNQAAQDLYYRVRKLKLQVAKCIERSMSAEGEA